MKYICSIIFLLLVLFTPVFSESWDDLEEGEHKAYGSEREEKYPVNAIIWQVEKWDKHYANQVFWIYKYTNYPKYESYRFFPFYSYLNSKIDTRYTHRFLNYKYTNERDTIYHSFFPFIFVGYDKQNDFYSLVPFFYLYANDKNKDGTSSKGLITPLFFTESYNHKTYNDSTMISPLFVWNKETHTDSKLDNYKMWFPIIPLAYFSRDNHSSYKNILGLFSMESDNSGLKKFWLIPFVFYKPDPDSYTMLLPPIYMRFYKDENHHHRHLFPIFWKHVNNDTTYFNFLLLFDFKHKENQGIQRFWTLPLLFYKKESYFHFLPFFLTFKDNSDKLSEEFSLYTILGYYKSSPSEKDWWFLNINWTKNLITKSGSLDVYPFLFWNFREGSKNDFKLFPIYYKKYGQDGSLHQNILGFLDTKTDESGASLRKIYFPLYYSFSDPQAKTETQIGFPLYFNRENPQEDFRFKTFLPIYWNWKTKSSEGLAFFPIWASFETESLGKWTINFLFLAQQSKTGLLNPDVSVRIGRKDDKFYLDVDTSILLNMFSISTRISATNPFKSLFKYSNIDESPKQEETDKNKPSLVAKKTISRENSLNFWGMSWLWGVAAYESADTKKHFRVFPLMWFSWDKNSEDKIYTFLPPFFIWYTSDNLDYKVVFPLFASQRTGKSFIESYLLFGYLREYDEKTNTHEHSALWPLFNYYYNDSRIGSRWIPLYWYRRTFEEHLDTTKHFSLVHFYTFESKKDLSNLDETRFFFLPALYYYKNNRDHIYANYSHYGLLLFYYGGYTTNISPEKDNPLHYTWNILSPLYFQFSNKTVKSDNQIVNYTHQIFFPIPFLYTKTKEDSFYANWLLLFYLDNQPSDFEIGLFPIAKYFVNKDEKAPITTATFIPLFMYRGEYTTDGKNYLKRLLLPIFYYKNEIRNTDANQIDDFVFNIFGIFYYKNDLTKDSTMEKIDKTRYFIFPLYYSNLYKDPNKVDDLYFSIFYYIRDIEKNSESHHYSFSKRFYWLYYRETIKEKELSSSNVEWNLEEETTWNPLYYSTHLKNLQSNQNNNYTSGKTSWLIPFTPIPMYSSSYLETDYKKEQVSSSILFYSVDSTSRNVDLNGNQSEDMHQKSILTWLWYYSKETGLKSNQESSTLFVYFPFLYREKTSNFSRTNFLFLFDWKWLEDKNKTDRLVIFPYWYSYDQYTNEKSHSFLPFFYYTSTENKDDYSLLSFVPFLYRSVDNTEKYTNFMLFHDSKWNVTEQKYERFVVFPYWYSYNKYTKDRYYNLLPIWYYTNNEKNKDYSLFSIVPFLYHSVDETETHTNFMFLFDWKRKDDTTKRLVLFPFWYSYIHYNSTRRYMAIPLVFYNDYKDGSSLFLAGLYTENNSTKFYANFLYLLYFESYKKKADTEFGLLFGLFSYKNNDQYLGATGFNGYLFDFSKQTNYGYSTLLWLGYKREHEQITLNFVPLFYQKKSQNELWGFFLPALGYYSDDKRESFNYSMLGLLHYNDQRKDKHDGLFHLLLGTLYYEKKVPEDEYKNKFTSQGSLWGFLWERQTEKETGFNKFSILKFVYSKTENKGKTTYRVFGIRFEN